MLGDQPGAREAAERIVAILSAPQRREVWSTNDAIVLRDAERTLEALGTPQRPNEEGESA
jgi:hypothetical protein